MVMTLDLLKIKISRNFLFFDEVLEICDRCNVDVEFTDNLRGDNKYNLGFVFDSDSNNERMYKDKFSTVLMSAERLGRLPKPHETSTIGKFKKATCFMHVDNFDNIKDALESLEDTSTLKIKGIQTVHTSVLDNTKCITIVAKGLARV